MMRSRHLTNLLIADQVKQTWLTPESQPGDLMPTERTLSALVAEGLIETRRGIGVERRASELGYQALTASSQFSLKHELQLIEQFIQMGVAGIVLYPTHHLSDAADPLATRTLHPQGIKESSYDTSTSLYSLEYCLFDSPDRLSFPLHETRRHQSGRCLRQ